MFVANQQELPRGVALVPADTGGFAWAAALACVLLSIPGLVAGGDLAVPPADGLAIVDVRAASDEPIPQFGKFEVRFLVTGAVATMPQWPYDPTPPAGLPAGVGITVTAVFTDPAGRQFSQPAFHYEEFLDEVRGGRDWHLPTGRYGWAARFSPNEPGTWSYKLLATDRSGTVETPWFPFSVQRSAARGFVRVSRADSRYFEFDNGTLFHGVGFQLKDFVDNPITQGAREYAKLAASGVNFVRVWISSMFGSAWNTWIGGRNQYRGYLPVTGLTPFQDPSTGETVLTMKLDYESSGDVGWFDACRMQLWWLDEAESIQPNTLYRIRVEYRGAGITGPRNAAYTSFGLVAKLGGGWHADCHEPGTSNPVTSYGGNNTGFGFIEGRWWSAAESFLPRMHLALENVAQGAAYVKSVSLRADLGNGAYGPELMMRPSMEHQLYIPEEKAHSFDKVIEAAERTGVYLKLVLMEKNDKIYLKMQDDGSWAGPDNADGFYGLGRGMNKTRWLQQMWWRYAQARWGYSPSIHSWELTNEGDPVSVAHYELADEFGKFMQCRVFGVEPGPGDGAACNLRHPNAHMVTTSFWHSFPSAAFWTNAKYPNVDYADVHAYVSTSFAPIAERERMQWDAAYFHWWHSAHLASLRLEKPVIRGEAGLDAPGRQSDTALGIARDTSGVWLHNYLWSSLAAGGLHELYWWNSHIWSDAYDHRPSYLALRAFMEDVPLHKGGYSDWGGTVSDQALRVTGQKNTAAGAMHLWVQNRQHTWKNVVDGVSVSPVSAEMVVPGFAPGQGYLLERWDTYVPGGRIVSREVLTADASGTLRIGVTSLTSDVALKVRSAPRAPTGLHVRPGA